MLHHGGPNGTPTHMVDTRMVGITRSGMTSKRRRTSNQAVGLQKEGKSQMYHGTGTHKQANENTNL